MFFTYRQNNSGGSFIRDESVDIYVIIEAVDYEDADRRAENVGIYFDGCADGSDCECCGDRWSNTYGGGDAVPSIYGVALADTKERLKISDLSPVIIHYMDGTKKRGDVV